MTRLANPNDWVKRINSDGHQVYNRVQTVSVEYMLDDGVTIEHGDVKEVRSADPRDSEPPRGK